MKKTIKEANKFVVAGQIYVKKNPAETKLHYALKKVRSKIDDVVSPLQKKLQSAYDDNAVRFACVDDKKRIVYEKEITIEPNGNKIERNTTMPMRTAEIYIALNEANRILEEDFYNTEIEFEPYIATEIPELTEDEKEAFAGYVIPEV